MVLWLQRSVRRNISLPAVRLRKIHELTDLHKERNPDTTDLCFLLRKQNVFWLAMDGYDARLDRLFSPGAKL